VDGGKVVSKASYQSGFSHLRRKIDRTAVRKLDGNRGADAVSEMKKQEPSRMGIPIHASMYTKEQ